MSLASVNAAQRHAMVTLAGIDHLWHTMTGGGRTVTTAPDPYVPGGVMAGAAIAEDITLVTSFSAHRDLEWIREMKRAVGSGRYTVVRQWTDENWSPVGEAEIYPDCLLLGYTNPPSAPSGDYTEFSVVLSTTGEAL